MKKKNMSDYLRNNWKDLTEGLPKNMFYENLVKLYNSKGRSYHNLNHIEALLKLSDEYKHLLSSKKTIDFSIWYHDAIYDASKSNNEEKSAELARKDLTDLGLDAALIENCFNLIIATKAHQLSKETSSFDAQFLLDIDLSILAVDRDKYIEYTQHIRKEYRMYPNFLYKKGRKKVLNHFLEMEYIYKTELFKNLWEDKAKENLKYELSSLKN
jgi:predicted metal-dependent HD superfamily phosphohydrolase